jgi:hypothetical protein
MTTAFQPDFFQSDSFQIDGGVTATTFEASFTLIQDSDGISISVNFPDARNKGAGKSRKRKKYIAKYKGEDYAFETIAELESFINDTKREQAVIPKKVREPIKITLSADYIEDIPSDIQIPPRFSAMPTGVAIANIKKIDRTLEKLLADAQRLADEQDEEDCLMCLL